VLHEGCEEVLCRGIVQRYCAKVVQRLCAKVLCEGIVQRYCAEVLYKIVEYIFGVTVYCAPPPTPLRGYQRVRGLV